MSTMWFGIQITPINLTMVYSVEISIELKKSFEMLDFTALERTSHSTQTDNFRFTLLIFTSSFFVDFIAVNFNFVCFTFKFWLASALI